VISAIAGGSEARLPRFEHHRRWFTNRIDRLGCRTVNPQVPGSSPGRGATILCRILDLALPPRRGFCLSGIGLTGFLCHVLYVVNFNLDDGFYQSDVTTHHWATSPPPRVRAAICKLRASIRRNVGNPCPCSRQVTWTCETKCQRYNGLSDNTYGFPTWLIYTGVIGGQYLQG